MNTRASSRGSSAFRALRPLEVGSVTSENPVALRQLTQLRHRRLSTGFRASRRRAHAVRALRPSIDLERRAASHQFEPAQATEAAVPLPRIDGDASR